MSAPTGFRVRRVLASDWQSMRDLRLQMLQDTPKAYLELYESAVLVPDEQWRARIARHTGKGSAQFAAVADDGRWIGTVGAFREPPDQVHLVSVFVAPEWRGHELGVTDALVSAAQQWGADWGAVRMRLFVHEDNPRARAYYRRRGFTETGATMPYELEPSETEIEMVIPL